MELHGTTQAQVIDMLLLNKLEMEKLFLARLLPTERLQVRFGMIYFVGVINTLQSFRGTAINNFVSV